MDMPEYDFNLLFQEDIYDKRSPEEEKKIFDFDIPFFGFDLTDNNISCREDGTFDVIIEGNGISEEPTKRNIKSLGTNKEYISMLCRLREFGYPGLDFNL